MASALPGADPNDPSAAQGQIIQLPANLLGGIDVAALGHSLTSNPSAPGNELAGLNVSVLQALNIDVGTLNVPLLSNGTNSGLLQLGDLGAAQSFSHSPSQTQSIASSGTITAGGAIDTGAIDGSSNPAQLELTDLFDQLGVAGLTDEILDQASVSIGALASRAEENAGAVTSEYRVADLGIDLHSQLIDQLADGLASTVQGAVTPVSDLVGPGGALTGLLGSVSDTLDGLNLVVAAFESTGTSATIAGLDTVGQTVVNELLNEPVENETGSVLIDLETGTISVDLAKILVETGAGADLNSLDPNTPVLSADTITAIQEGVTSALTGTHPNSLNGKLSTILTSTLNNLQVELKVNLRAYVPLTGTTLATGDITISGTLAQFAGIGPVPTVTPNIVVAGLDLSLLTGPVVTLVTNTIATTTGPLVNTALTSTLPLLQTALANATGPLLTALDPVLQGVLSEIVDITINEQPTEPPTEAATGDLPGGSFTVRALSIDLLPLVGGGVSLDLGSSTVKAAAAAAVPEVVAEDPVQAGANLTVTGTGWPAATQVTLQITDAGGANIGGPVTVTTTAAGELPAGTVYPIPAGTAAGDYTLTATEPGGGSDTDTVTVTAAPAVPEVVAEDPVQAGTNLSVTGTGWPAATQVTLQITGAGGANIGGPVTVTTTAAGELPAGTVYPIPADTAAGDYTLTATEPGGGSDTDTVTVTAADPGDVNTNAAASASASADATADGDPSAQAAAVAAAFADATAVASADADATAAAAAQAAATVTASATASTTADADVNASAAVAAQAAAQADASDDTNAAATAAANANSSTAAEAAATADSSVDASSEASTNANATASASASANADASSAAVAQAAAQAAAYAEADSDASAAGDVTANAAAQSAATATASTAATADVDAEANAGAAIAAQAAALADATSNTAADTSADDDASTSAAANASAAAIANASTDASTDAVASATADADPDAELNTNASASAAASAQADDESNAAAQAAAVAAALANADTDASAAADITANAAAQAAATATASTNASTTATADANVAAAASAQAAAQADATSTTNADSSAAADADPNASAAAAATATSSATASATAAADATASATADPSAAATTTASSTAQATSNANASADPAGKLSITVKHAKIERGQTQTAVGTGFKPGEVVTGVMGSPSVALGTQVANDQGTVTFSWAIPSNTALGAHTVTLSGPQSGSVVGSFEVVADGLATTGGEAPNGWIALGVLLLLFGLGTALVARAKRVAVIAE